MKSVENKSQNNLTPKQKLFIQYYIQTANAYQSYIKAGYTAKTERSARNGATALLSKNVIKEEITRIQQEKFTKNIASAEEVMDFFSRVMRGEVKDQFGLETSVADRIKAAQELAKRTIDIEHKKQGLGDNILEIKLDWSPALLEDKMPPVEFTVLDE